MIKKNIYLLIILALFGFNSQAQTNFTMKEAVTGLSSNLAIKNLKQLKWMGESDIFSHVISNDSIKAIVSINPKTFKTVDTFAYINEINDALKVISLNDITAIPNLNWLNENTCYFDVQEKVVLLKKDKKSFKAEIINTKMEDAENDDMNEKTFHTAFVKNNNLFLAYKGEKPISITNDGNENIVYGKPVHRDEFGIDKGIFWSNDGSKIAFYRMDQTMVENYPVVNWTAVPATVKYIKYPFAGRTSHQVTLGVYDLKSGSIIYLKIGEPKDHYLTCVTWSPDGNYIYIGELNREQNDLKLNKYNALNGEFVQTLLEEKNDKYVEPQHPLYFLNNNADQFIWWSQRDGYMHLYLYKSDGTLVKQLTQGPWMVNEIVGYNATTDELIFTATKDGAMNKNGYALKLQTNVLRNLNKLTGWHTLTASKSGSYVIDAFNAKDLPRAIEVNSITTKLEKRIFTAHNPLEGYNMATVKDVTLYTSDSTALYGKLMLPYNFDSTKKYPTITYLYNGPHLQLNKNTFPYSGNLWYDYLTQHGYIVFVLDGRGSSNRGFAFESATHTQLGSVEMDDQLLGVNYLKSLPYVNAQKMGVHGWSFGGFMTTSLMLRHPGVFVCGVAGGPVLDWSNYEVMYTERYMKTPQTNPEGYANSVLHDKVKNLKGKLLLIHGTDDDVVVWQHSLKMIKKSVDEGVQVDYFVYPGHPHNVKGKDRIHLMQKITDYFDSYLK